MDGLIEALKQAGVPTPAAVEAMIENTEDGTLLNLDVRKAIAADRDAVLRVLLAARLAELSELQGGEPGMVEMIGATNQIEEVLDLLAPEAPRV